MQRTGFEKREPVDFSGIWSEKERFIIYHTFVNTHFFLSILINPLCVYVCLCVLSKSEQEKWMFLPTGCPQNNGVYVRYWVLYFWRSVFSKDFFHLFMKYQKPFFNEFHPWSFSIPGLDLDSIEFYVDSLLDNRTHA